MWSLQGADGEGPHEWSSFVFSNRSRKSLKILVYDSQGFWIFHKRLSRGSFKWWRTGEGVSGELRASELAVLIWNGNPDLAAPQTEWKSTSNFVKSAEDFSDVESQEEDPH
ncbi:MAG: IS66 family insertion sequence element accessory protein TnpB [Bdellovibrionales bacterium]|nr:IS66 family insertion sequence element accessory protein TnpB [Bdellovibrionales bacterium]